IDCGLILVLAEVYGQQTRAIQLCGGALLMGLATPLQMRVWLKDALRSLNALDSACLAAQSSLRNAANQFGLPAPPAPPCPSLSVIAGQISARFEAELQHVIDIQAKLERLLRVPLPGLAIAYENALSLATINARFNKESEARHLAGV